jgi:hypothetical protein
VAIGGAIVWLAAGIALAAESDPAVPPTATWPDAAILMADDFEDTAVFPGRWWMRQALPGRYWIDSQSRAGRHSLALQISESDRGCGIDCQRNEIRTDPSLSLEFGKDVWFSFSFHVDADALRYESSRWVSGQWKQQTDGGPFLSQRFDHGVFHIAVHDEDCRVLVAKAAGELDPVGRTVATTRTEGEAFRLGKDGYGCEPDVTIETSEDAVLPDPFVDWVDMTYRVRGGLNGTGLIEIWANGRFIARVTGSIGYSGAAGEAEYFKFGIYRDAQPGSVTVYLDNFKLYTRGE